MTKVAFFATICALAAAPATAQFLTAAPAEATLVEGFEDASGDRIAGLALALDPGWKTYWRAPGEAGIPPTLDWSGSENLASAEPLWPAPHVFDSFGIATIGYDGDVTIPLKIEADDPSKPVRLRLVMDYGVCSDICVPARAELSLDIAPGAPERARAALETALAQRPLSAAASGVTDARCVLRGAGEMRAFSAEIGFHDAARRDAFRGGRGARGRLVRPGRRDAGRRLAQHCGGGADLGRPRLDRARRDPADASVRGLGGGSARLRRLSGGGSRRPGRAGA
jgi:DsbC/DsbD-like thiol-disulfide interchange protein